MNERVVVGDFSMSAPESKRRWVAEDVYVSPFGFPQTPTELSRYYVTSKYEFPLKIRTENAEAVSKPRPAPLMAIPTRAGVGSYIDISQTYWQIINAVGWDVEYWPKRYLSKNSSMSDAPEYIAKNKLAYCGLLSMARPTVLSVWNGKELTAQRTFNQVLNMRLVALVHDVLNGIACDLLVNVPSLCYVNTDGYIVADHDVRIASEILSSWGLNYKQKAHGSITVDGVGAYKVGKKASARDGDKRFFSNIEPIDYKWLKRNFATFAMGEPILD